MWGQARPARGGSRLAFHRKDQLKYIQKTSLPSRNSSPNGAFLSCYIKNALIIYESRLVQLGEVFERLAIFLLAQA